MVVVGSWGDGFSRFEWALTPMVGYGCSCRISFQIITNE